MFLSRFSIGFFWKYIVCISLLCISGCAKDIETSSLSSSTPSHSVHIIAMGDSLTQGYGLENPQEDSYPAQLEKKLQADGYSVFIENMGIAGETTTGGRERAEWVSESNPDIVLLFWGANDMFRGIAPALIKQNMSNIIDVFLEKNITVILMPMQAQSGLGEKYQAEFNQLYTDLAKEKNIALTAFPLNDVALIPQVNLDDGIHPNEQGYEILVENIYSTVTQSL